MKRPESDRLAPPKSNEEALSAQRGLLDQIRAVSPDDIMRARMTLRNVEMADPLDRQVLLAALAAAAEDYVIWDALAHARMPRMEARHVGYWEDLAGMPSEGPFLVVGGPVGANVPRIEQARGPEGIGCPIALSMPMRLFMEENKIPRGHEGAAELNARYRHGAFRWVGHELHPKEPVERTG